MNWMLVALVLVFIVCLVVLQIRKSNTPLDYVLSAICIGSGFTVVYELVDPALWSWLSSVTGVLW